MPPKAAAKEDESKLENNIPSLAENLTGNQTASKIQLTLSRGEAAYYLWRHTVLTDEKRQLVGKAGCIPYFLTLADRSNKGDQFGKFAAVGSLQALVERDEGFKEIVAGAAYGPKSIASFAEMLTDKHDRTKLGAAKLLYLVATTPEYTHKVLPFLPQLLAAVRTREPAWADIEQVRVYASGCIAALAVTDVNAESFHRREEGLTYRPQLVKAGVLPVMVELAGDGLPEARLHALCTIHKMLLEDDTDREVVELGALPMLIDELSSPLDQARAHAAACLMLISKEEEYARMMVAHGAIAPLLALLTPPPPPVDESKKKKKKKKEPPLPPAVLDCIIYASGALRHLSFDDENCPEMEPAVPQLQKLIAMKGKKWNINMDLYQCVSGLLYNLSLHRPIAPAMDEAAVPKYLADPLPERYYTEKTMRELTEDIEPDLLGVRPMTSPALLR